MTTIYEFAVVEGQEWVLPVDEAYYEVFFSLDGTPLENWDPPVMRRVSEGDPSIQTSLGLASMRRFCASLPSTR